MSVIELSERVWVGRNTSRTVGMVNYVDGSPTDADGDVEVTMVALGDPEPPPVFSGRTATHNGAGTYQVVIGPGDATEDGTYRIEWHFEQGGNDVQVDTYVEVGQSDYYDALPDGGKEIIESVWNRLEDLYDSPQGGVHLQVYVQTNFGRNRLAQLAHIAVGKLNTIAQPHQTYALDSEGKMFPFQKWGAFLEHALWIETLRHLRRSYVEQPDPRGVNVSYLDRKNYANEWGTILREELEDFNSMMDHFKIAHMGFGKPRVMVYGGIFGTYATTRVVPLSAAARPVYYWAHHAH